MPELLLDEEEIVGEYSKLVITTHRVIYEQNSTMSSMILIENVSGISTKTKDYPLYLIFGAIALFLGLYFSYFDSVDNTSRNNFLLLVGAVLLVIYFLLNKAIVSIKGDSGDSLEIPLSSYTKHDIETIICKIMIQKNKRLENLYK